MNFLNKSMPGAETLAQRLPLFQGHISGTSIVLGPEIGVHTFALKRIIVYWGSCICFSYEEKYSSTKAKQLFQAANVFPVSYFCRLNKVYQAPGSLFPIHLPRSTASSTPDLSGFSVFSLPFPLPAVLLQCTSLSQWLSCYFI